MESNETNSILSLEPENNESLQVALNIEFDSNSANDDHVLDELVGVISPVVNKKKRNFVCFICGKKFKHNAGKYNHMRSAHNVYPTEKSNVRCLESECSFSCTYKEKLQLHLVEQHGMDMEISVKSFDKFQDFLQWKEEFEKQEKCRFVKKSGARQREEGVRVAYYYCSRSGTYVSQNTSSWKKKGTSKSNNHCTASITCVELGDGKVQAKVCSTHYGHDTDLQFLRLTLTEKYHIAEQLSLGVPREVILDNLRASAGSDIDKIHLIGLKDIKNIEKSFGVQGVSNKIANDMVLNLKTWVDSMQLTSNCPVAYFNEEGVRNTKTHDITLVLLTVGQVKMIEMFAKKGIFYVATFSIVSRTHCTTIVRPSALHITAVMLVDDINEAFPISFMVTNKHSTSKIRILFDSLKKRVPEISANALLTDGLQDVYNEWCTVFDEEPYHFWSNRFVDKDWRNNLITIPDEDLQVSIYEKLYSYIESSDTDKLEKELETYISELQEDENTNRFALYFTLKYLGHEKLWAGCYGKQQIVGMNVQLNMELAFNELEELTLRKHWDRNFIVKIIQILLKYVSDKQCTRQTQLNRQVQDLPNHHQLSLSVKPESIIQQGDYCWRVNSVKDPERIFSIVTQQQSECDSKCSYYCTKCNICAHKFHCSCQVYAYDKTMCKHIHAVAFSRVLEIKKEDPDGNNTESGDSASKKENFKTDCEKSILIQKEVWKGVQSRIRKRRKFDEDFFISDVEPSNNAEKCITRKKRRIMKDEPSSTKDEPSSTKDEPSSTAEDIPTDVKRISTRKSKVLTVKENIINKRKNRGKPKIIQKKKLKNKKTTNKVGLVQENIPRRGRGRPRKLKEGPEEENKNCGATEPENEKHEPRKINILRKYPRKSK